MRSLRYLNGVLTVLAVLLTLHLLTTWTLVPAPSFEQQANAQAAPGTDPGMQRRQMIDLLKLLVQRTEEQTELLKSGQVRVRVEAATPESPTR